MIRATPMISQAMVTCTIHTQDETSQNPIIDGADGFQVSANTKKLLAVSKPHGSWGNHCLLRQSKWQASYAPVADPIPMLIRVSLTGLTWLSRQKQRIHEVGKECVGDIKIYQSVKLGGKFNHISLCPCIVFSKIKLFKRKLSIQ